MGLVLAIMTAIQNSNQAVKSSSLGNDWVTLLAGIRDTFADSNLCTREFNTFSFPGAALAGGAVLTNLPQLTIKNAGGAVVSTFLSTTQVLNSLKATTLQLVVSPGNTTQTILVGGVNRYLDHVELNIVAQKVEVNGTTALMGGVTTLQSNATRNNAIKFTIMRDTGTGAVIGCYGQNDSAQQACNEMGGSYGPAGATPPRCQLPRVFFGSNDAQLSSPAAGSPNRGQRVQLWAWSGHGIQDPNDYAIGMNGSTMWFNAGEAGGNNKFQFTNNGGTSPLLTVGSVGTTVESEGGNVPHGLFGYVIAGGPGAFWAYYDKTVGPPANGYIHIGKFWNFNANMDCGADAWLMSYKCDCYCTDTVNCHARNQGLVNYHAASCNCFSSDGGIGLGDMYLQGMAGCAKY